jgi:hypothetical protein
MIVHREEDVLRVVRPRIAFHPTIQVIRQRVHAPALKLKNGKAPFVALVAASGLSPVSEILAIWRIGWSFVPTWIGGDPFRLAARGRDGE